MASRKIILNADEPAESVVPDDIPASSRTKKIVITPLHETTTPDETPKAEPAAVPAEPTPTAEPEAAPADKPVIDDEQERATRSARVAELVTAQTYVLPIETIEERRSKQAVIAGALLIVILLLAWYNVALDARLLPNTFGLPHTGFFGAN